MRSTAPATDACQDVGVCRVALEAKRPIGPPDLVRHHPRASEPAGPCWQVRVPVVQHRGQFPRTWPDCPGRRPPTGWGRAMARRAACRPVQSPSRSRGWRTATGMVLPALRAYLATSAAPRFRSQSGSRVEPDPVPHTTGPSGVCRKRTQVKRGRPVRRPGTVIRGTFTSLIPLLSRPSSLR